MKHLPLIIAALALSAPLLQAKVYDITLSDATTYRQCQIKYRGSNTKFVGKDKKGKLQTVTVPSSRILNIREVEEEAAPEPEPTPAPEAPKAEEVKTDEVKEPAAADGQPEEKPAEAAGAEAQPAPQTEAAPLEDGQAQNASLRLRSKLGEAEKAYEGLRAPSKSIQRRFKTMKERITGSLDKLDKQALTVADLQQKFNQAGQGEFTFDVVTSEQRDLYVRDGKAAYDAMVIDMKEKPGARKVGGIDKFEIMRDRYQGIPEYKMAYEWYVRTLKALDKKWNKMLDNEEMRRKKLQPAKKVAMQEADEKELEKLRSTLEEDGEDIAKVWYNPRPRNLQMLKNCCNKVHDALRRNENTQLDEAVGTVPSLLGQFWAKLDEARRLMMEGRLDQAEATLDQDPAYDMLRRMKTSIFPNDYRSPIMEQRKKLETEIRERKRNTRNIKMKLEREAAQLERAASNAEAQIDALLEDIQREKDLDSGENSVDMEESMNEPEAAEGGAAPAEAAGEEAKPAEEAKA